MVLLALTPMFYSRISANVGEVILKTNKDIYELEENVEIILQNEFEGEITLRNSAPWKIYDSKGEIVFTPVALQVIVNVSSGETKTWIWNQRNNKGEICPSGSYWVELAYEREGVLHTVKTSFKIRGGEFTFNIYLISIIISILIVSLSLILLIRIFKH